MSGSVKKLLADALDKTRAQQKVVADAVGVGESTLSDWKNGLKVPPVEKLPALAKALAIELPTMFRAWLDDCVPNDSDRDRFVAEVMGSFSQLPKESRALSALRPNSRVHHAARKAIDLFNDAENKILEALAHMTELKVVGDKGPRTCVPTDETSWSPMANGSRIDTVRLFLAKLPAPFLAELHRFSAQTGAMHRQDNSMPASYEFWSIVSGTGLLAIEEADGTVLDHVVRVGMCGFYWGSQRHFWVNPLSEPLIVYHCFFPHRTSGFGPNDPGEAAEVDTEHMPESTHSTLRAVVESARRRLIAPQAIPEPRIVVRTSRTANTRS